MSIEQHRSSAVANNPADRFEDPGLPPHVHRKNDSDPKKKKWDARIVVAIFSVSALASLAGVILFFVLPDYDTNEAIRWGNLSLGLGLGIGFFGIGIAAVYWARALMNDEEMVEERHLERTSPEDQAAAQAVLADGVSDAGIKRRPLIMGALGGALALVPLPFVVPLVSNLAEDAGWDISKLKHTMWKQGTRLVTDPDGRPIRAQDVTVGSVWHVIPEGLNDLNHSQGYADEKAKAVVLVVRIDERELKEPEERKDWSYNGIVAYSKICTHVGCPVALYEQQTKHLLCPCHQSTFDMTDQAKVVFGPAKRPLPQLPITVDDEGYLIAQSDFHEPVGPSYWERVK